MKNKLATITAALILTTTLPGCASVAYDLTKGTAKLVGGTVKLAAKTVTATGKLAAGVATAPFRSESSTPEDFSNEELS